MFLASTKYTAPWKAPPDHSKQKEPQSRAVGKTFESSCSTTSLLRKEKKLEVISLISRMTNPSHKSPAPLNPSSMLFVPKVYHLFIQ